MEHTISIDSPVVRNDDNHLSRQDSEYSKDLNWGVLVDHTIFDGVGRSLYIVALLELNRMMLLNTKGVVEDVLLMMMGVKVLKSIADVKDRTVVVSMRIKKALSAVVEERICLLVSHDSQTSPTKRPFYSAYLCLVSEMSVMYRLQWIIPIQSINRIF
jgi:hypothetical protein